MKLHADVQELLDGCGLPWRVVSGSRHYKLVVAGHVVTILPKSAHAMRRTGRRHRNAMAHIKRGLKELEQQ